MNLLFLLPIAFLLASGSKADAQKPAKKTAAAAARAKAFQAVAVKVANTAKAIATKALAAKAAGKPAPALPANASQARAARALCAYLREPHANWGAPGAPSPQVVAAQAALGVKLSGFTDAATRMAIAKTGVVLPERPKAAPSKVSPTVTPAPAKPPPYVAPAPAPAPGESEATKLAKVLRLYLTQTPARQWGNKGAPNKVILAYQKRMGLTPDGIYGTQVQAAARAAGVELPDRNPGKR